MNGYEMLVKEFDALKMDYFALVDRVSVLSDLVEVLLTEREAAKEAERKAAEKDAEMWAYYQAEEYEARQALIREGLHVIEAINEVTRAAANE